MTAIHDRVRRALLGLSLATMTACGSATGGGDKPAATATSAQPVSTATSSGAATPGCALLSPSEAGAALSFDNLQAPEATVNGIVTICLYGDGKNDRRLTLRFQTPTSPDQFKMGKDGFVKHDQPVEELKGLGDDAYTSTLGAGNYVSHSVVFLHKNVEVMLTSSAPAEKLQALAHQVLAKL